MSVISRLINESRASTRFVLCLLLLGLYYYCYRYILQYNSVSTSPTYSDTPQIYKLTKYILLFVIYLYFVIIKSPFIRNRHSRRETLTYYLCVIFNVLIVLSCCLSHDYLRTVQTLSLTILPIFFYHFNFRIIKYQKILTFLLVFYLFAILYEMMQLVLFEFWGRLPALAYKGTTSIRFGGPWDDPNGWGVALSFFIPFSYFYTRKYRFVMVVIGLVMLLLTQSLTAIGAFVASVLFATYLRNTGSRVKYVLLLLLAIWLCVLLIPSLSDHSFLHDFFRTKQRSISDHMNSTLIFGELEWYNYIVGNDQPYTFESDIANMIGRGGLLLLGVYLALIIKNITDLLGLIKENGPACAFWKASLYFQVAFLIASVNMPCSSVFYLFLMFNVILCLSTFSAKGTPILYLRHENSL